MRTQAISGSGVHYGTGLNGNILSMRLRFTIRDLPWLTLVVGATVFFFFIRVVVEAQNVESASRDSSRSKVPVDAEPAWKAEIFDNLDSFRALFKPATYGACLGEVGQWQGGHPNDDGSIVGPAGGQDRIAQLEAALKRYPDSPFSDDAALLLARAVFMYGKGTVAVPARFTDPEGIARVSPRASFAYSPDAEKAIDMLYDVIKKCPDGSWIAEDPVVQRDVAVDVLMYYPRISRAAQFSGDDEHSRKIASYMGYLAEHPNKTADEAKCCIAWIIFETRCERRYLEAEQLLHGVVERYRAADRTHADEKAAKSLGNDLISSIPRAERSAAAQLIEFLRLQGRRDAAIAAADDYAKLFKGHDSVPTVVEYAKSSPASPVRESTSPK